MENNNQQSRGFFDGNPKMIFVFGLVSGIALALIFGGGISLPSFNNGSGGSKVVRTFDIDDGSDLPSGTLAPITEADHIRGDINKAKVVMVEYSDFECPFCERHHPNMLQAMEDYGDDIAWVYRHYPLSFHPKAVPAAEASECAAEQGKFWEFADAMFEDQDDLGSDLYESVANDLGLNMKKFNDCVDSGKYADVVTDGLRSGSSAGVQGTPATFVNGVLVSGAVPYSVLQDAIDQALAQ